MSPIPSPRWTGTGQKGDGPVGKARLSALRRTNAALFAFLLLGSAVPANPQESPLALPPEPPALVEISRPQDRPQAFLAVSRSGTFALEFPGEDWYGVDPDASADLTGIDLAVYHRGGRAWVKGRLARRSNRGVEGALIDEATHAKHLIEYEPEDVEVHLSTETYRGSALYCGRLRQGKARKACSLVAVALHGRQMVRLHSLVDATTPARRQRLLADVRSAFGSLRLLAPNAEAPSLREK